jgi:hypothetical protein
MQVLHHINVTVLQYSIVNHHVIQVSQVLCCSLRRLLCILMNVVFLNSLDLIDLLLILGFLIRCSLSILAFLGSFLTGVLNNKQCFILIHCDAQLLQSLCLDCSLFLQRDPVFYSFMINLIQSIHNVKELPINFVTCKDYPWFY